MAGWPVVMDTCHMYSSRMPTSHSYNVIEQVLSITVLAGTIALWKNATALTIKECAVREGTNYWELLF